MTPAKVVDRLFAPTARFLEPSAMVPLPSIEPAVVPTAIRNDRSMIPAVPLIRRAVPPPVLLPAKSNLSLLVMVALPAVPVWTKA